MNFFRLQNNRKGFTLTEVVIAAGILGGLGVVLMYMTKEQTKSSVQAKIDADMAQAKSEISSILSNPAHCNANFYGKSATSAPGGIFTCPTTTTGSCLPGTPNNKIPKVTAAWTGTGISDRVRVSNLSLVITDVEPIAPATRVVTTAALTITFESKNLNQVVKSETITFNTPVVYNGTTVTGCPKTWNSTVLY